MCVTQRDIRIGRVVPLLEVRGTRLLWPGVGTWLQAADGGQNAKLLRGCDGVCADHRAPNFWHAMADLNVLLCSTLMLDRAVPRDTVAADPTVRCDTFAVIRAGLKTMSWLSMHTIARSTLLNEPASEELHALWCVGCPRRRETHSTASNLQTAAAGPRGVTQVPKSGGVGSWLISCSGWWLKC
jgi:hypothetical protein